MKVLRKKRHFWSLTRTLTFAAFLLLTNTFCTNQEGAWQRIRGAGILHVGLDPTYPPFENADGGELRGIDVDLAKAIGERLDLKVEFVYFGYDGLYDGLLAGKVDVLFSALVIMTEKTKDFSYSSPYFNAGQVLLAKQSELDGLNLQSGESTIAVELGTDGHVEATAIQRRNPELIIVPYDNGQEALKALSDGEANVAIVDHVTARFYLRDADSEILIADSPITNEAYAAVVRSEDELLLSKLNDSLNYLRDVGRLQQIISIWLD